MWIIILAIMAFIIVFLSFYIIAIFKQMKQVSDQLNLLSISDSRQHIHIKLLNNRLGRIVGQLNELFDQEEIYRIHVKNREQETRNLVANLSHDLRTPLTITKGYLELLRQGKLNKVQSKDLNGAIKSCNQLQKLMEQLFEFSYLVSNPPQIHCEKISITKLITEHLMEQVICFEERNLEVYFDDYEQAYIFADVRMTDCILKNLLSNCVNYGYESVIIEIEQLDWVILSIKNRICDKENIDISRVFERCYSAKVFDRKGTGLGLSIVQIAMEQMGGKVYAFLQDGWFEIKVYFKKYEGEEYV